MAFVSNLGRLRGELISSRERVLLENGENLFTKNVGSFPGVVPVSSRKTSQ